MGKVSNKKRGEGYSFSPFNTTQSPNISCTAEIQKGLKWEMVCVRQFTGWLESNWLDSNRSFAR